jgi:hypothetical protein
MVRPELRDREISVYLPSKEHLQSWRQWATEAGMSSLNKYIVEMVNRAHDFHLADEETVRVDVEEFARLTEENNTLIIRIKDMEALLDKQKQASETIIEDKWMPLRCKLVKLLRTTNRKCVKYTDIFDELNIKVDDTEAMRVVGHQLREFQDLGIAVEKPKVGWQWIR